MAQNSINTSGLSVCQYRTIDTMTPSTVVWGLMQMGAFKLIFNQIQMSDTLLTVAKSQRNQTNTTHEKNYGASINAVFCRLFSTSIDRSF